MALEKEDIMALIAILQKGLTDDEPELLYEDEATAKPKAKRSAKKTKSKPEQSVPETKPKKNKFEDMPERHMHKEDTKIDKILWGNRVPTPRRRSSSLVQIRCRICGKTEQVNSILAEAGDRYKCNKCATTSG